MHHLQDRAGWVATNCMTHLAQGELASERNHREVWNDPATVTGLCVWEYA